MKTISSQKMLAAFGTMLLSAASTVQVTAATLDLEGVNKTVTDVAELAAYDGVTNSSGGDPVTLTFNLATDMSYAGTISGNIRLVKNGNGFLNLSGNNTYTGGTQIDHGRLVASSLTAFGATTGAITVNSDCNLYSSGTSATCSNRVTCVVFGCAGDFAYPINTSTWTYPDKAASGYSGIRYYNVAVTVRGVTLSGKITGGGLSVHFGGLKWAANAPAATGSGSLTISGDIDCGSGTCSFDSLAQTINITGKVTTLGIYQNTDANWPPVWSLGGAGNSIGLISVGGSSGSLKLLTASTADALGGATIYTTLSDLTKSFALEINADQTVESFSMNPSGSYAGGSLAASASRHYVLATAPATVTMLGTANRTNDWCLKDGGATKAMSLVWNPTGEYTYTCVGQANTICGTIAVSNGTFRTNPYCSFSNVTAVALGSSATLALEGAPFSSSVAIEAEPGATLDIAEDITVATVKVGDKYLSAKDFSAGTYKGLTITGAGTLYVSSKPGGEGTYTWLGGGGDNNITTVGNWQDSAAPDFSDESPFIVVAGGTAAVLDCDVNASGITFDGVTAFELSASGNHILSLGAGGISNAPAASARSVTVSAPVMPIVDQVWQMETNTTFTLSGVLKKYGTSTPTLTFRQSSYADPTINIIGAATAEGASDFAGDIVFEETPLPNSKYGTAYVRASGYEPFGPGGTLKLKSRGEGHSSSNTRQAELFLSNAVISKAVQYGEYYTAHYCADDNSTNVMSGAFTAYNTWGTSNSTFPPTFYVGANSVLRLCGDMDFGTRNNSDTANLVLGSTATIAANKPTGKIVFDGRITRLPRRLGLGNAVGLELNAAGNAITNLNLRHNDNATAVVSFGASYALSNGQAVVTFPTYDLKIVDFDLNGTVQHIAGFSPRYQSYKGDTSRISSSDGPATLRVSQPYDVEFDGYVATNVTLQMEGAVALTFTHSAAFRAGSTLAVSNGTVAVSYASALNEDVTLKLMGGNLSIPSGQTAMVGEAYYLDGSGNLKQLHRGTYGPGDATVGAFFAPGSGSIRVMQGEDLGLILLVK